MDRDVLESWLKSADPQVVVEALRSKLNDETHARTLCEMFSNEILLANEDAFEIQRRLTHSGSSSAGVSNAVKQYHRNNEEDYSKLRNVLNEPVFCASFLKFLQQRYCEENLLFYRAAVTLPTITSKSELPLLENIVNTFIKEDGKQQVNVDSGVRVAIEQTIRQLHIQFDADIANQIFAKAVEEVVSLMQVNGFDKFKESDLYVESFNLLKQIRGRYKDSNRTNKLTTQDWKVLTTGSEEKSFVKGENIIRCNTANTYLYVLISGRLKVMKDTIGGPVMVSEITKRGTLFGEMSLFSKYLASATVIVESETAVVQKLPVSFLLNLFAANPVLGIKFYCLIGNRLAQKVHFLNACSTFEERRTAFPTLALNDASPVVTTNYNELSTHYHEFHENFATVPEDEQLICVYDCSFEKNISRSSGILYISQHYISFWGCFFGQKIRELIPLFRGSKVTEHKENAMRFVTEVHGKIHKYTFRFKSGELRTQAVLLLRTLIPKPRTSSEIERMRRSSVELNALKPEDELSDEDWELILGEKAGKQSSISFVKGDRLMKEGYFYKKIYQIVSGEAVAQKVDVVTSQVAVLLKMERGEVLGEINFFTGIPTSVDVIAVTDTVEICLIDKEYVSIELAVSHPQVVLRFYKHLVGLVAERLHKRENVLSKQHA